MKREDRDGRLIVGTSGSSVVVVLDNAEGTARVALSREGAIRISEALRRAARNVGAAVAAARRGRDE